MSNDSHQNDFETIANLLAEIIIRRVKFKYGVVIDEEGKEAVYLHGKEWLSMCIQQVSHTLATGEAPES